jgi:hypothetical protein
MHNFCTRQHYSSRRFFDSRTKKVLLVISGVNLDVKRIGFQSMLRKTNIKKDHLKASKYGNLLRQLICVPWIGFITATSSVPNKDGLCFTSRLFSHDFVVRS